jgi:hypothetical protein
MYDDSDELRGRKSAVRYRSLSASGSCENGAVRLIPSQ